MPSNWIFNFIIAMVSPDAFAGIGGYFYLVIAGFCLFSACLAHFYYVETANHTLEEVAVAFGDKAFADSDEEVMESAHKGSRRFITRFEQSVAWPCRRSNLPHYLAPTIRVPFTG